MPTGKKKGNGKMKKKISKVINGFMVAAASVTTVGGVLTTVPVQAAEPTNQSRNSGDYMVNKGVVDFGEGTANITIKGNAGQSLVGKRFEVFQLFNAENAKGGESINYTFKDKYATALKTVVASALTQIYDCIDYEVPMYVSLYNYSSNRVSENIFNWNPSISQWWGTGFNWRYQDPDYRKMIVIGKIVLDSQNNLYTLLKACKQSGEIIYDEHNKTVWIQW